MIDFCLTFSWIPPLFQFLLSSAPYTESSFTIAGAEFQKVCLTSML
jgi:hypothetical protein